MKQIALGIVSCSMLLCAGSAAAQDRDPGRIEDLRVTVTGHDVNRPSPFPGMGKFSWPGNIVRLPDGELLLVHSAGYYHVSFAEPRLIEPGTRERWLKQGWPLDFSAPTGGRSMISRSKDGGSTWSQPKTLVDLPWDDSPYGLLRCRNGTLLCFINVQASWYGFEKAPHPFQKDLDGLNTRQCVVRSTDNGETWSQPIWLKSPGTFYERSHAQPIELPDGVILWPTYFKNAGDDRLYGAIHRSTDSGETWSLHSIIRREGKTSDTASSDSGNIDEPAIARLTDGRLFLITRPDGGYFVSDDDGKSWTFMGRLVKSGKFKAPRLFVLEDGKIVCVCTYRGLTVFIGKDAGKTWSGPIALDSDSYGYPGGWKLKDDTLLVSYCSSGRAPNRIHAARFRVNAQRDGIELLAVDSTSGSDASKVIDVGTRKQLFVDDFIVAEKTNVTRTLGKPVKANSGQPLIVDDQPWEEFGTPIIGTVLRDRGMLRMWYRGSGGGPNGGVWCYAESSDGLRWKKPRLGLVEFDGSKENSIFVIGQPQAFTPFVDPNETDPARRYKSAVNSSRIDTALAHSADGLRWNLYRDGQAITGRASDTISQVLWDPAANVYRLYTRTDFGSGGGTSEIRGTRDMVARADADLADPKSWKTVREWCLGWEKGDRSYHQTRQIYSLNGWMYEGVQFAILWTLEKPGGTEFMQSFLATTRGTSPWNLEWVYGDRPFVKRGPEGAFDCRWIQPSPNIVTWKDQHWIYYVGLARSHAGKVSPDLKGPVGGIGLATLRLDGFVALEAGENAGTITTKPFTLSGNTLEVNVDASGGDVQVEILDEHAKPIAGFSSAGFLVEREVDNVRWRPRWRQHKNLASLTGRTLRLRFHLRNAKLYSFRIK